MPIVAGVVSLHDVPIYLTGVGTVIAYNTVTIRSQIQGKEEASGFGPFQATEHFSLHGCT